LVGLQFGLRRLVQLPLYLYPYGSHHQLEEVMIQRLDLPIVMTKDIEGRRNSWLERGRHMNLRHPVTVKCHPTLSANTALKLPTAAVVK